MAWRLGVHPAEQQEWLDADAIASLDGGPAVVPRQIVDRSRYRSGSVEGPLMQAPFHALLEWTALAVHDRGHGSGRQGRRGLLCGSCGPEIEVVLPPMGIYTLR